MGDSGTVVCQNCSYRFDVLKGIGKISYILMCYTCGKQKMFPIFNLEGERDFHCQCGGQFIEDATVKCPKCRSTDYEYVSFINWH